jgi:GTPase
MQLTVRAYEAAMREMPTRELTKTLEKAMTVHQPPMIRGRRIKLRYAHPFNETPNNKPHPGTPGDKPTRRGKEGRGNGTRASPAGAPAKFRVKKKRGATEPKRGGKPTGSPRGGKPRPPSGRG